MSMTPARNWISYMTDALIEARTMPAWEAIDYMTQHLFGECPNLHLHQAKVPHEAIRQFVQRIYEPIMEAVEREMPTAERRRLRVYTDISLISPTTVLIVSIPDNQTEPQLLLLEALRPWDDLVFPDATKFNAWAEQRYKHIREALLATNCSIADFAELQA